LFAFCVPVRRTARKLASGDEPYAAWRRLSRIFDAAFAVTGVCGEQRGQVSDSGCKDARDMVQTR
jgi:hypothetical protein